MELYGRQYDFSLTVGAACEIAEHCPGGELQKFQELIQGPMAQAMAGRSVFICALSRGAEETRAFTEPGYQPAPLTPELLRTLPIDAFNRALAEASAAFLAGLQTAVGIAPAKKNEDGEAAEASGWRCPGFCFTGACSTCGARRSWPRATARCWT